METIDKKRAEDLLERYFAAETSLEEEELLREYFSGADVSPEHAVYTQMFCAFAQEREMLNMKSPVVTSEKFVNNGNVRKFHFRWMSVAAAAVLAIFAFLMIPERGDSLKLIIDGVNVKNRELAISKADTQLDQVNSLLGKFREGSTKQIDNMNKMGDALTSFKSLSKIMTQNTGSDRLE
jgi:hypothetical protein